MNGKLFKSLLLSQKIIITLLNFIFDLILEMQVLKFFCVELESVISIILNAKVLQLVKV